MAFPKPITCPKCDRKANVHIYLRAFICSGCGKTIPLTTEQIEGCYRVFPSDGKKSLVPPERAREEIQEEAPAPRPYIKRPFPGELPRLSPNPSWTGVPFPGDYCINAYTFVPFGDVTDELIFNDPAPVTAPLAPAVKAKPKMPSPEPKRDMGDASELIRKIRERCGRPLQNRYS